MWSYAETQELAAAIPGLSSRCLKTAALFAGEQLLGLTVAPDNRGDSSSVVQAEAEEAILSVARGLLECGSYNRCVHLLAPAFQSSTLSPVGLFLHQYATYLGGEKAKEEEMITLSDPLERFRGANVVLRELRKSLTRLTSQYPDDSYLHYLHGVILKELLPTDSSLLHPTLTSFVTSLQLNPYNWSCWLDLSSLCHENANLHERIEGELGGLTSGFMWHFFLCSVFTERQQGEQALKVVEGLEECFGNR